MRPWIEANYSALVASGEWRADAGDDTRMRSYYRRIKRSIMIPVPSLVEHRMDMPSTLGHPSRNGGGWRTADWFIGADESWASVDWAKGAPKL
jgi:hypothetical protein